MASTTHKLLLPLWFAFVAGRGRQRPTDTLRAAGSPSGAARLGGSPRSASSGSEPTTSSPPGSWSAGEQSSERHGSRLTPSRTAAWTRGPPAEPPPGPTHLDYVLLLGDGLIGHFEAQRVLQGLHQQQVAALTGTKVHQSGSESKPGPGLRWRKTYEYVGAVDKLLQPLLGNQQHPVKQEERSLLLHSLHLERTFQDQLSEPAEVWTAPVHQQGLDFLSA